MAHYFTNLVPRLIGVEESLAKAEIWNNAAGMRSFLIEARRLSGCGDIQYAQEILQHLRWPSQY